MNQEKKIEAVIFDWAGTTVDYGCFAPVQAFVSVFENAGITPAMREVREPMGMLKWDHIRTMLEMPRIKTEWKKIYGRDPEDGDADHLYKQFQPALFRILPEYTAPKPYVKMVVDALREKEIKIGSTTGYTDSMMEVVVPGAKAQGYAPDCWYSPDATHGMGRPFPYMIFKNMEELQVSSVEGVIKVGDTISDIREGKNAGVFTVGVLEGSSELGMTEEDYLALTADEQERRMDEVRKRYLEAGADAVVKDIRGILELI